MSTQPIKLKLWKAQKGLCWICLEPLIEGLRPPHPLGTTIDHLIGVGAGGVNKPRNKLLAHADCNQKRGCVSDLGAKLHVARQRAFARIDIAYRKRLALVEEMVV